MAESIPGRFAEQVRLRPDRVAVTTARRSLTYADLNRRANGFAAAVAERGGRAGQPVALLMDHDAPLIVAMLGVVKAGGISLCLDRDQPAARLGLMLDDAQPSMVIDKGELPHEPTDGDPATSPAPHDEALLFYTSGSSGRPKGVVHNHRSVVFGAIMQARALGISQDDRLALLHSCSVAASRSMLYGGLLNGATVCLFDVRREGVQALADWMRLERITVCHMVPSLFRAFASALPGPDSLPALRVIKLGGETLTRADVDLYRRRFDRDCVIVNGLGATEIGCGNACYFTIGHDTVVPGPLVPVGHAAEGVDLRLLDEHGRDVPPGEIGEIIIRSEYLASGYWRDPESSRRAFAPIAPEDPTPSFRTGDLGRRDAAGCLTHLGRKDQQVKIRGNRVEVLEVEAALREVGGVTAAAIVIRPRPAGEPGLTAFFVPSQPGVPSSATVRTALAEWLPRFMIPSSLIARAELPTLPGGKLDRQALDAMAAENAGEEARSSPPAPVERGDRLQLQLKGIWEQALEVSNIGVRDDFFELGGHSLAAAEICSRIERVLGIRLPLVTLVEAPTIERLAQVVRDNSSAASWSPLVPLQPNGANPPLYCVPGAGSDVFALQDLARHLAPGQPLYGLQPRGLDGVEPFHRTLEEFAAYYVGAIRAHQPNGPYYLAGTSLGGTVAFEMAHQIQSAGEAVGALALLDAQGPGYPRVSPALRIRERMLLGLQWVMPRYLANLVAESWIDGTLTWPVLKGFLRMAARYGRAKAYTALPHGWVARPFELRFECLQAALFSASARYVARPLSGRIDLFRTAHHPGAALFQDDPELGWHGLATGGVHVRIVPGVHSQHIREPNVGALTAELRTCLAEARG